jgi:prolyl-tRNA synthetase
VIIPISGDEHVLRDKLEPAAEKIERELNSILGGLYVKTDKQYHMRPGDRFFHHLQRGVPLRIELGEREHDSGRVTLVRRDTSKKESVSQDALAEAAKETLEAIQKNLYDSALAFRESNTRDIENMEEMKKFFSKDGPGGFARTYFAGTPEDEGEIKYETGGATIRCMPTDDESRGKCVYTGKPGGRRTIFAKAY